ncbi:MAG: plastocyanin/azurin family copper-binding protein [Actinomycetota bacterium]
MRRWNLLAAVIALGLLVTACASNKDTGFPQDVQRTEKTVNCSEAVDDPAPYEGPVLVGDNCYLPKVITVASGTTVMWEQLGVAPHSVTAADDSYDSNPDCLSDPSTCMAKGDTFEQTFDTPGEYTYYCVLHGSASGAGMAGKVIVEA